LSPQRKAKLAKIPKELGQSILLPKHYVKTRWLSLRESLMRFLEIWEALTEYMKKNTDNVPKKKKNKNNTFQKFDYKHHLELLESQIFT